MKTRAEQLTAAIAIANKAHAGQTDRGGTPYILHCIWVMERQSTTNRKICAVLHDVVEDTDVTLEDLRSAGFTERQVKTIDLLTRRKNETKMDAIRRLISAYGTPEGQDAIYIKLEDNNHNRMLTRLRKIAQRDYERNCEYAEIYKLLYAARTFAGTLAVDDPVELDFSVI